MAARIDIPLSDVQKALGGSLILDHPPRCSRCGTQPAAYYETHKLRLRIGANKPGLYRQTYRVSRVYYLRLRVCETCYQADFAICPEEFQKDETALGRLARTHSRLFTIGTLIACTGLLLMTNLVPANPELIQIKSIWPYITGFGGAVIIGTWLHQRTRQRRILESLESKWINPALHPRAEARTIVLENEDDATAVVLQIKLYNEDWAAECAAQYNWATVKLGEES